MRIVLGERVYNLIWYRPRAVGEYDYRLLHFIIESMIYNLPHGPCMQFSCEVQLCSFNLLQLFLIYTIYTGNSKICDP